MYYHRYLAEFVLGNYERVDRDTMRNIRLMDFCRKYAQSDTDKYILEQYRAYVIMMRTRARRNSPSTRAGSRSPCRPRKKASPTSRRSTTRSAGTRCRAFRRTGRASSFGKGHRVPHARRSGPEAPRAACPGRRGRAVRTRRRHPRPPSRPEWRRGLRDYPKTPIWATKGRSSARQSGS